MQQPMAPQAHPTSVNAQKKRRLSPTQIVTSALLLLAAVLMALVLVFMVVGGGKGISGEINKDKYQAVFLNSQDGQVYFGKLEIFNDSYYKLTDIYYVRVEQKIQPEGQNSTEQTQQSISLAKLGNELHGPEDVMYIARDKVLFWENLKEDGQVVKAIREYQRNPNAATQNNQQNSQNTNTNNTDNTNTNTNNNSNTNSGN